MTKPFLRLALPALALLLAQGCQASGSGSDAEPSPHQTLACTPAALVFAERAPGAPRSCAGGARTVGPAGDLECATGEHLPMRTPAEVRHKHDFLAGQLTAALAAHDDTLRDQLIARLELLHELRAAELGPEQRAFTLALYDAWPGHACGPAAPALPSADPALAHLGDLAEVAALERTLSLCGRLGRAHVSPAAAAAVEERCLGVAAAVAALPASAAPALDRYRELALHASGDVVARALAAPISTGEAGARSLATRPRDIQVRLARIDRWYKNLRRYVYPNGRDLEPLWAQTSQVVASFWEALRLPDYAALEQDPTETAVRALDQSSFALEQDVLLALFTPSPAPENRLPLAGAPLLALTSDALTPLAGRLRSFSGFHDLSCLYLGCDDATGADAARRVVTPLSARWRVLARLHDRDALGRALDASTVAALSGPWRDVFGQIYANQQLIGDAIADVTGEAAGSYTPALALDPRLRSGSGGRDFAVLLDEATRCIDSYDSAGLFDATPVRELPLGLSETKASDVETELGLRTTLLHAEVTRYHDGYAELLRGLLDQMTRAHSAESLETRALVKQKEFLDLEQQIIGFAVRDESQRNAHGAFMQTFEAVLAADVIDQDRAAGVDTRTFSVSGRAAKYQLPSQRERMDLLGVGETADAQAAWTLHAMPGEILNLTVTGQWSPTCALESPGVGFPLGDEQHAGVAAHGALTGPQGFYLTTSQSAYKAQERQVASTDETYSGSSNTNKVCGGAKVSVSANLGIASAEAYARVESCVNQDQGERHSDATTDSDSSGHESRISASLQPGLRLEQTPFPDLPAGSLVLVQVVKEAAPSDRRRIQDAQVVLATSSFVISKEVDVYLVVNDKGGCQVGDDKLTVTIDKVTPLRAVVKQVGAAMAAVVEDLAEHQAPTLEAQGRLLDTDEKQIRTEAFLTLGLECSCDPSTLPTYLMGAFDARLSYELARIGRFVAMRDLERQRDLVALELRSLHEEAVRSNKQARFAQLLPAWTLRQLDAARLQGPVDGVIGMATRYLYPILRLRYPQTLRAVREDSTVRNAFAPLRQVSLDRPIHEVAEEALVGVERVATLLRTQRVLSPALPPTVVVVGFPRPGVPVDATGPQYRRVDAGRAHLVWDDLARDGIATFLLEPNDLYASSGGDSVLGCDEAFPVIRSMAVHIATRFPAGADDFNGENIRVPMKAAAEATFVTSAGTEVQRFGNPAWLGDMVKVLLGKASNVAATFTNPRWDASRLLSGSGLSPFTRFTFDLSAPSVMARIQPADASLGAKEILLVFQVERQRSERLSWVGACKP